MLDRNNVGCENYLPAYVWSTQPNCLQSRQPGHKQNVNRKQFTQPKLESRYLFMAMITGGLAALMFTHLIADSHELFIFLVGWGMGIH